MSNFSHIFLILFHNFAILVAQSVVKKPGNQEVIFFNIRGSDALFHFYYTALLTALFAARKIVDEI